MKKNKPKQNLPISRNNHTGIKNQLSFLATNAKIRLNQNQNLNELIKIKEKQISRNKDNLTKFSAFNKIAKDENEISNEVKKEIKAGNNELLSLNIYWHKQINNLNEKYTSLKKLFYDNNSKLINQLDILKDRKFILENALIEKESEINRLQNDINEIYDQFYDKIKVENFVQEESCESENEFNKILNNYKDYLLNKSMGFNKYKKMNSELKRKIIDLKTKIKNINRYINTLKNLNTNFDCIDFSNYSNNIYIEGEECLKDIKDKSEISINITNINLNTEDSLNEIITNVEPDDIDRYDLISNTYIEEKSKINLQMPLKLKLDLSQICYNRKQSKIEDKEKSLSRNNNDDKDLYSIRINKMKNKINSCVERQDYYIEKINKYKEIIKEIKQNINNLKAQPVKTLKIKSIKRRNCLLNSSGILQNNSLSSRKKIVSDGIDHYHLNRTVFSANRNKYYK